MNTDSKFVKVTEISPKKKFTANNSSLLMNKIMKKHKIKIKKPKIVLNLMTVDKLHVSSFKYEIKKLCLFFCTYLIINL